VELLKAGRKIVVVDNLCNSDKMALDRVQEITQCDPSALQFRYLM
jgi:UDP-glucose 4-epimerase